MLEIRQGLIDFIVSVRFRNQAFEFDPTRCRHLEHFFDIMSLPARYTCNGDLTGDKTAAADGERAVAQTADNRCGAARSRRLNDLIGGFRIADGLECLVHAAVGELSSFLHRIHR